MKLLVALSLAALLVTPSFAQEREVAATFDAAPVQSEEAVALANRCIPSLAESDFRASVTRAVSSKVLILQRPVIGNSVPIGAGAASLMLVINPVRALCVLHTMQGRPVLPLEAFSETVEFEGMAADVVRQLRASFARQMTRQGSARGLVKADNGNAFAVAYLFASNQPSRMYFNLAFLRPGEYDESSYEVVVRFNGNARTNARIPPRGATEVETFKLLYAN